MAQATATAMDALDINAFLAGQRTGVLALAKGGSVYAFPVSFAFDEDGPALYFRFGYGPNSQKRAYVEGADEASFVVHDHTDEGWKSVLAEGHLRQAGEAGLDTSVEKAVNRLRIPYYAIHRRPADELEFSLVRLDVDKLSGVVEARRVG